MWIYSERKELSIWISFRSMTGKDHYLRKTDRKESLNRENFKVKSRGLCVQLSVIRGDSETKNLPQDYIAKDS